MYMIGWGIVAMVAILTILFIIRWVQERQRPTYPLFLDALTGALDPDARQEAEPPAAGGAEEPEDPKHPEVPEVPEVPASLRTPLPLSPGVLAHYRSFFAVEGERVERDDLAVPIVVFPPTRKRGWWTYATAGLHRRGQTELLLYSYKRDEAMIAHLVRIADDVQGIFQAQGTGIAEHVLFPLPGPIIPGSALDRLLAVPPFFEQEGFGYYYDGDTVIRFLMLLPVTEAEYHCLLSQGWDALVERFVQQEVNALDLLRHSAVDGGECDESDPLARERRGGP
ncbi:suppressor of fused domain protein [Brevibacillus sp. SYP-B805]|uniref:suppressor of fused domain protein n=1 Tax=Brevibacillus sp. SYP-B805 TaxID=1578199 RepID=UPI0013EB340B|nr:suppressor of fused domain protein [Brevibacillus sp. SYP-B805]NGQ95275.1 suppressor of fused domain protein [Brevibacillus sp. SYP-B805]